MNNRNERQEIAIFYCALCSTIFFIITKVVVLVVDQVIYKL